MGSHSSYAGSRPASGLSKRRAAFHGPPPSFYEQGGYGATGRRGDGYTSGKAGPNKNTAGGGFASAAGFGSDAGAGTAGKDADPEDWVGFINRNPLHHFNARGHFRTQAAEDQRRRERRSKANRSEVAFEEYDAVSEARNRASRAEVGSDTFARFMMVSGMLVFVAGVTGWLQLPAATSSAADLVPGGKGTRRREAFS